MQQITRKLLTCCAVAALGCLAAWPAAASAKQSHRLRALGTIHIVNARGHRVDPAGFDLSWIDQERGRYYLSDGINNAIDVVDTRTDRFMGFIGQGQFHPFDTACTSQPGIGPYDCASPHGLFTDKRGRVWVADSSGGKGGSVVVLNPRAITRRLSPNPRSVIRVIRTGSAVTADEMAYDPRDNVVLVANPASVDGYLTWISARTLKVLGTYHFSTSPTVFNGIEQPVWDARDRRFYVNLPGVGSTGTIDAFRAKPGPPVASLSIAGCGAGSPTGLVFAGDRTLFSACANGLAGVNVRTHRVNPFIASLGAADQIAYNPDTRDVYVPLPFKQALGVYNTRTHRVTTAAAGHSFVFGEVAAYRRTGQVFVAEMTATRGLGIEVFGNRPMH